MNDDPSPTDPALTDEEELKGLAGKAGAEGESIEEVKKEEQEDTESPPGFHVEEEGKPEQTE